MKSPYGASTHDHQMREITEAFQAKGAKGVMELTGLHSTQVYRIIARFELIRARDFERNL